MIIGYIERNLDYLHLSPIGSSAFRNMFRGESELRKPFTGRGEQIVVVCEKINILSVIVLLSLSRATFSSDQQPTVMLPYQDTSSSD